jgi:hypothetical protein
MKIARIDKDGKALEVFGPTAVRVPHPQNPNDYVKHGKDIFVGASAWSDKDLNRLGFARLEEEAIPQGKQQSGDPIDTLVNGKIMRSFNVVDVVDKTPSDAGYDYASERLRLYPATHEMVVALWEHLLGGDSRAATALEAERQAIKLRFPKE